MAMYRRHVEGSGLIVNDKMEGITRIICEYFKIDYDVLRAKKKIASICEPRQIAMFFCYEKTNYTWASVGGFFGKNHATAIHAHKKVNNLCEFDVKFRSMINELFLKINTFVESNLNKKTTVTFRIDNKKLVTLCGFTEEEINEFKQLNNYTDASN